MKLWIRALGLCIFLTNFSVSIWSSLQPSWNLQSAFRLQQRFTLSLSLPTEHWEQLFSTIITATRVQTASLLFQLALPETPNGQIQDQSPAVLLASRAHKEKPPVSWKAWRIDQKKKKNSVVCSPSSMVPCPATCVYSILTQAQHHSGAGTLRLCGSLTLPTVFKSRAPGLSSQKGTAVEYNLS